MLLLGELFSELEHLKNAGLGIFFHNSKNVELESESESMCEIA